ncbi:MAG: hypothetical protein MUQ00_03275, partial [Candidatus Aminicenantes bacterium]|nr:hypothetical protein [Candidatus Aminicenantes bacterium]
MKGITFSAVVVSVARLITILAACVLICARQAPAALVITNNYMGVTQYVNPLAGGTGTMDPHALPSFSWLISNLANSNAGYDRAQFQTTYLAENHWMQLQKTSFTARGLVTIGQVWDWGVWTLSLGTTNIYTNFDDNLTENYRYVKFPQVTADLVKIEFSPPFFDGGSPGYAAFKETMPISEDWDLFTGATVAGYEGVIAFGNVNYIFDTIADE